MHPSGLDEIINLVSPEITHGKLLSGFYQRNSKHESPTTRLIVKNTSIEMTGEAGDYKDEWMKEGGVID